MLSYSTKQPTTLSEIPQATTNCACANVFLLYLFLTSKGEIITTNDGITKTTKKMPQEILLDLNNLKYASQYSQCTKLAYKKAKTFMNKLKE